MELKLEYVFITVAMLKMISLKEIFQMINFRLSTILPKGNNNLSGNS